MLQSVTRIMDALDIETLFVCDSEDEGRSLMLNMLKGMGFKDVDIVFIDYTGMGARVRGRAYVHRPADKYSWLGIEKGGNGQ